MNMKKENMNINMSSMGLIQESRGNKALNATGCPIRSGMTMCGEAGRSMVEMLGVLAIVGIISVAGVAAYRTAMNQHFANELLNEASKRATVVAMQAMGHKAAYSIAEFDNNEELGFTGAIKNPDNAKQFQLTLSAYAVEDSVCERAKQLIGDNSIIQDISEDCTTLTFNNDLSTRVMASSSGNSSGTEESGENQEPETPINHTCALNEALSSGCTCPAHRDTSGGVCGNCVAEESYVAWTQPTLTSNNGNADFTVQASSEIGSPRLAWRAFDGSNNDPETDCWHSEGYGLPSWLSWHTTTPLKINSITITNRNWQDDYDTAIIKNFEIQYQDNNSNWQTAFSGTNPRGNSTSTTYNVNIPSGHNSWRVYITSNYDSYYTTIGELTIDADALQTINYTLNNETLLCE